MSLDDLHDELRAVARDLLGKSRSPGWSSLADAGWLGLEVSEDLGGAGATFAETAVVLHEMGRALTTSPYLGTILAVHALELVERNPARDALLRLVGAGDRTVAVAMPTGDDDAVTFRIDGGRLSGSVDFVPDASGADRLLVPARTADGETVLAVVHDDAAGLTVTEQPVLDATRNLGVVAADGVEVNPAAVWPFDGLRHVRDRGALAVACDSLGAGEAMLDATVAYAKVREQFGRPIGSFQAVKHACADMLVQLTIGRELVNDAVNDPVTIPMAKSYVGGSAVDVVGKALQLHGGIGYTWESGIHVHLKRATLNRSLFGSPLVHRRRLAERWVLR